MATSDVLREIFAAGRPLVEQWLDVSEQIAALRDVATAKGLDWSQVKALLKAMIQDERDDTGEGKRVRRIVEKAEFASAYADMLGLANMNENNFSAERPEATSYAEAKGVETQISDQTHSPLIGSGSTSLAAREADDCAIANSHSLPNSSPVADTAGGVTPPASPASHSQTPAHGPCESIARKTSETEPALVALAGDPDLTRSNTVGITPPAIHSDADVPAFLMKKSAADYRPHCQRPDACGASGLKHCYTCQSALDEVAA